MRYFKISILNNYSLKRIKAVFSFIISIFFTSFIIFTLISTAIAAVDITNVNVSAIKTNSAVIKWDSTVAGTSQIEYGTTASFGSTTSEDSLAYFHVQTINNLTAGTFYHYRIRTREWNGTETISSDHTFTTRTQTQLDTVIKAARSDGQLPKTYYVSPTGNDANNGLSTTAPWKTLNYASSKTDAGDTVYLLSGTWTNDPFVFKRSGIDVAPISLMAYSGAKPILSGGIGSTGVNVNNNSYIIIDGLEIKSYSIGVLLVPGSNNKLSNSYVHDTADDSAVTISDVGTSFNTIENSTFVNAGWNTIQLIGPFGTITGASKYTTVKNNTISHSYAHASIDLYGVMQYVTIDGNNIYDSPYQLIFTHDPGQGDHQEYVTIKNNYFHDTQTQAIQLRKTSYSLVYNNTFRNIRPSTSQTVSYEDGSSNIISLENKFYNTIDSIKAFGGIMYQVFGNFINTDADQIAFNSATGTFGYGDNTVFILSYGGCTLTKALNYYPTESSIGLTGLCSIVPTTYPMTVRPASGSATVTVNKFDTSLSKGNILVSFTADTTNGNNVTFTVSTLKPNTNYLIKKDSANFTTVQADSSGKITFSNSVWSPHTFTVEESAGSPTTGNTSGNITDKTNGAPIAGATVNDGVKTTTTDAVGNFFLANITTGSRTITASKTGYQTASKVITVVENSTVTLDFQLSTQDTSAPSSVTRLVNASYAQNYINWTWSDPSDSDFNKVMVYLGGVFQTNVSKGVQNYNATGLAQGISYTISTKTVDTSGNINSTWVNHTARTVPIPPINSNQPSVTDPSAIPSLIADDTDNDPRWGELSQLNITIMSNRSIASVTIDLSSIGRSSSQPMVNTGGNIWSVTTSAPAGTPPQTYNLKVNATDIDGISNTSVGITLTIMKNGDTNGNGIVNIIDAMLLSNYVAYPGQYNISSLSVADVNGDGVVNIVDAQLLSNYASGSGYILR